jgi:hypothetical protein
VLLGFAIIPVGLNVSNAKTANLTFSWTMDTTPPE